MAHEQVVKAVEHDVVHARLSTKIAHQRRAGPGDRLGLGKQRQLQRCEIAQAQPLRAAFDGAGNLLVINAVQQARDTVAAAADHRYIGTALCSALNGRQARFIVASKARPGIQRRRVHLNRVAHFLEARHATAKAFFVAHRPRGRIDIDAARAVVVVVVAMRVLAMAVIVLMVVRMVVVLVHGGAVGPPLRRP